MKPSVHFLYVILSCFVCLSAAGAQRANAQEIVYDSAATTSVLAEPVVISPVIYDAGYSEWVWRGIGRRGHWVCTCDCSKCGFVPRCPPFRGCLFKRVVRVESRPPFRNLECGYCEWRNGVKINSTCVDNCSCDYRFVNPMGFGGPGIIEVTWCKPRM